MQRINTTLSSKISSMEEQEEDEEERYRKRAASTSHGSISVIGKRRMMEDAVKIVPGFMGSYDFFAVYDGHGGATVANACRERMHLVVAEQVMKEGAGQKRGLADWLEVMCSSFMRMDREVVGEDGTVGSTAVVVVVSSDHLLVANCGDSRAVLCRGGVAFPLSKDHKPNRPDERERVEKAGGTVISWNGDRVLGILATSRSIGDHYMKPYVVSEPEVKVYERTERDEFMVIASDGLWDVISNKLACEVVRRIFKMGFVKSGAAEAAALLAELAMARGSRDNISVIVVRLK
ncbi:protein phosphatase 2C 51-like [Neltuma alba]|uniref:protein phosphatase 2C 51-like n=1 Tax=Neltuma alba TaxID=207710 RepID=UPI0010A3190C|nr:protein phosphatase 2C 51-like [Prosopis alba]